MRDPASAMLPSRSTIPGQLLAQPRRPSRGEASEGLSIRQQAADWAVVAQVHAIDGDDRDALERVLCLQAGKQRIERFAGAGPRAAAANAELHAQPPLGE